MNEPFKKTILQSTGASNLIELETIQELWSGYGKITRFALEGSTLPQVVVKHVSPPTANKHPRGWNTNRSHERKLRSYRVESAWYTQWSKRCTEYCRVPKCYAAETAKNEFLIVLEDLNASGFNRKKSTVSLNEIKVCLSWLAHFHAVYMGERPDNLWKTGTYWHLATRPDELKALDNGPLKETAKAIDHALKNSPFITFVHGDAKLANFCFTKDGKNVAAVDFQYVGGGCGMKDVAYFLGSCLDEQECKHQEAALLDYYFKILTDALKQHTPINPQAVEENWRALYPVAWTDFYRFLQGWSPGHWKINGYSEGLARQVIKQLSISGTKQ